MRKLVYSMGVSLDGFIADGDGAIDWTAPDEELHRFHNQQGREIGMHLCGRRLYETMAPWETRDQDPDAHEAELEWAAIWKQLPKVVFSTTLESVEGNARLVRGDAVAEVARLKEEPGEGVLAVGGAGLADEPRASGARRRVRPVRLPGRPRGRHAVLPRARGPHRARPRRDADVRLARRVPPLRRPAGCARRPDGVA